jgi:hypothetical protein
MEIFFTIKCCLLLLNKALLVVDKRPPRDSCGNNFCPNLSWNERETDAQSCLSNVVFKTHSNKKSQQFETRKECFARFLLGTHKVEISFCKTFGVLQSFTLATFFHMHSKLWPCLEFQIHNPSTKQPTWVFHIMFAQWEGLFQSRWAILGIFDIWRLDIF